MSRLEYLLASALLRVVGCALRPAAEGAATGSSWRRPGSRRSTATCSTSTRRSARDPELEFVLLLEPYSYGLRGKLAYLRPAGPRDVPPPDGRGCSSSTTPTCRSTSRRTGRGTTVVQVWHAVGALKRFGLDTRDAARPSRNGPSSTATTTRSWSAASGRARRTRPRSGRRSSASSRSARRGPTSSSTRRPWRRRGRASSPPTPSCAGRRVVLYAPTFRGRGVGKRAAPGLDAVAAAGGPAADHALVLKTHPNLDPAATATAGYDVVVDPTGDINDLLAATDILITDYSSSIVEFALLRRPIVLLVADLADYEVDPGLYLDYRTEMIGTQVVDTDGVIDAIAAGRFDLSGYDAFIERQLGARGGASDRFVDHFLGPDGRRADARCYPSARCPPRVKSRLPFACRRRPGSPPAHPRGASPTSGRDVAWSATSSRPTSASAAPTPSSATSGGSSTRSSRWSSTSSS